MSYLRTAILLAGLTALFMGVGYLIGGPNGALIAFLFAAAMNFFAYWNADRMVLSIHGAQEVDEHSAPGGSHGGRARQSRWTAHAVSIWTTRSRTRSTRRNPRMRGGRHDGLPHAFAR